MPYRGPTRYLPGPCAIWLTFLFCTGCQSMHDPSLTWPQPAPGSLPHELNQVTLPPYIIEAPDVLLLDAVRLVPKPPYKIAPLDVLGIQVTNTLPLAPIAGLYSVEPDGSVNLGFNYGTVRVDGLQLEQAKKAVETALMSKLKPPFEVTVVLAETRAMQQIRGPHLVHTDGTVTLGSYGSVAVDGLTIADAKAVIEKYLTQYLVKPEISVDVAGFNSKVFYVITDGAGAGAQLGRFPVTGKSTVLDALAQINGLPPVAWKDKIYLVRPAPPGTCGELVLPVDWEGIGLRGETATNYQVLPGDRIYVKAAPLVTIDTYLARIISPIERLFGVALLGDTSIQNFKNSNNNNNNNNNN